MIEGNMSNQDIAARVLSPEVMTYLKGCQELRYQMVWSILARWAVNTPELLKVLGSSEMHLYSFLKKQYDRELDALTEYPQRRLTMADHEILADMGVMTELTKERLIEEAGFVRSEITQLLKAIN